jgi:transposase
MSGKTYTREFREEAVRQVIERGYSVKEVAPRIGVSAHSLYKWVRAARPKSGEASELAQSKLENAKLKAELRRVQEERDILKKAAAYFAKDPE